MKIVFAGSELAPFARTGGLGDVLDALPAALARRGHDVSIVLPCYSGLENDTRLAVQPTGVQLPIALAGKHSTADYLQGETPAGVQLFLIRNNAYFDRPSLYSEKGADFPDNAERFIFFAKAVLELARRVAPAPQILHLHDWQTALVPVLVREGALPLKTVLTIHNLAYQGSFWGLDFALTNLPGSQFTAESLEFYGNLNLLKGGILAADQLTTVSDSYAREIQTPASGCGLDSILRARSQSLTGILNGADQQRWDPSSDPALPTPFSAENPAGKALCKKALLEKLGLDPAPRGPVFAIVSRLAEQKGIDLLLPLLDRILADDVRLIVLGEGDTGYERELLIASKRHSGRFAYLRQFDEATARLIEAGSDMTLIPSHFEPCGLNAMYSLRHGCIPIARATGGLFQIVQDYDPGSQSGNGFLFFEYLPEALHNAITRAKRIFQDQAQWQALVSRAMHSNFSWDLAAAHYEEVYQRALKS